MSHATSEQPALTPAASQNPLSACEPWNLFADGYAETTMLVYEEFAEVAIGVSKLKLNSTVLDAVHLPGMVREPVEPHSNTTGEELWREKEKLALAWLEETLRTLKRPLASGAWLV